MTQERPIESTEAFALGALHGILKQAGVFIAVKDGIDINTRSIEVYGLVPGRGELQTRPCIRVTVEEIK